MRICKKLFLIVILFFFQTTWAAQATKATGQKTIGQKTTVAKTTAAASKKSKTNTYRRVVYKRKALSVLGLRQASALRNADRARYVTALRQALFLGEVTSRHLASKKIGGKKDGKKNADKDAQLIFQDEIWHRILFGDEADAAVGDMQHPRHAGSSCIVAANMLKSGEGPYQCSVDQLKGTGSCSGTEVPCGALTGLRGNDACVTPNPDIAPKTTYALTRLECAIRMDTVRKSIDANKSAGADIDSKMTAYDKILAAEDKGKSKNSLEKRLHLMRELDQYAVIPEIQAHEMKLAADILDADLSIPADLNAMLGGKNVAESVKAMDKLVKDPNAYKNLMTDFDKNLDGMDDFYFGVLSYCYSKLNDSEAAGATSDLQPTLAASCRQALSNRGGPRPKDCFARNECEFFVRNETATDSKGQVPGYAGRTIDVMDGYKRIEEAMADVAATVPTTSGGQPVIVPELNPPPPPPPPAATTIARNPYARFITDGESFGCDDSASIDPHMEELSLACFKCSMERDVQLKEHDANFKTSSRWMTLINIMARRCNVGTTPDGHVFNMNSALRMQQIFGQCSAQTFDWQYDYTGSALLMQNTKYPNLTLDDIKKTYRRRNYEDSGLDAYFAELDGLKKEKRQKREAELVKEYLDKRSMQMFGMKMTGKLNVTENEDRVAGEKIKDYVGLEDVFCMPMAQNNTDNTLRSLDEQQAKLQNYSNELSARARDNRDLSKQQTLQATADVVGGIQTCLAEALERSKKLGVHDELRKSNGNNKIGCYESSSTFPDDKQITTDLPLMFTQLDGASYNGCAYSKELVTEKEGDVNQLNVRAAYSAHESQSYPMIAIATKGKEEDCKRCSSRATYNRVFKNVCTERFIRDQNAHFSATSWPGVPASPKNSTD